MNNKIIKNTLKLSKKLCAFLLLFLLADFKYANNISIDSLANDLDELIDKLSEDFKILKNYSKILLKIIKIKLTFF